MTSQEDEDLARAIELSLQETRIKPHEVIDLSTESDDEDIVISQTPKSAESASKTATTANHTRSMNPNSGKASSETTKVATTSSSSNPASAFLAERAQLERERRERQKRMRPELSDKETSNNRDSSDESDDERPSKTPRVGASPPKASSAPAEKYFWDGELRQTANKHAHPRKDGCPTFRLTEMLGEKKELSFAILSSFSSDYPWMYQFFDRNVPVIVVGQPDETGRASLHNIFPNWIRTTPFLRAGRGCMHMKLFYKTGRLRVVVSTANLIDYDYRDMENSIWLQDIPLRSKPVPHDPKAPLDFPTGFQAVLRAVNVAPALQTMIRDNHPDLPIESIDELRMLWDWSKVKVQLVASIAGAHEGWPSVIKTGHPRLMHVVRKLGLRTGKGIKAKDLVLECQGSSLGNYTTQWLNEFHWSARGESAEDWLDQPKKRREKLPYPPIKIVFPSKARVQNTTLGEPGGGTVFCRRRQWDAKNFPRNHFYDSVSKAGPVLMHSKMIIGMFKEKTSASKAKDDSETEDEDDDVEVIEPYVGWAYVGSHNFTPSAWGTLSGSGFNPILNIANYELGIVIPLQTKEDADRIACFERPPRKYGPNDEPWIQEESIYFKEDA